MAALTSFRDIKVWQSAMQLAVDIYHLTGGLPPSERPGLVTELHQAAASIPTLIAAGHKTGTRSGMINGCRAALQSAGELETLLIITGQVYPNVPSNDLIDQLDEVQQLLTVAVKRLSGSTGSTKPGARKAVS